MASTGLRLYLSYVYEHGLTYGALATPITFLLFYYFISMAIIIGAQFNNALLEYYPPRISRPGTPPSARWLPTRRLPLGRPIRRKRLGRRLLPIRRSPTAGRRARKGSRQCPGGRRQPSEMR